MAIYDLKGYVDNIKYDYTNIRDKKIIKYTKELEMIFNPFINKDIKITQTAKKDLKGLFTLPIICLARIYDSVDFWRSYYGKNGYFKMLEEYVVPLYELSKFKYALPFDYLDEEIIDGRYKIVKEHFEGKEGEDGN